MDTGLIAFALVSFAAALALSIVALRTSAEQRRRSAARVTALASAIGSDGEASTPVPIGSLFARAPDAGVRGRPLIKAAVVGVLGVALIVFVTMATSRDAVEEPAQAAAAGEAAAPLELMNMRHVRNGTTVTVTGLVRNPASGTQVSRISAVVFTFDRMGNFVASASAPLDFTTLLPGDESPFVVAVPNVRDLGRYRVSFRTDAGGIRHVDRRTAGQAPEQPS